MQIKLGQFNKNSSEKQFLGEQLVKEYGYDKNDIEANYLLGDVTVDLAVFVEGQPHIQSNCLIAAITSEKDKDEGSNKLKKLFAEFPGLEFGIWYDEDNILYLRSSSTGINEVYNIPKKGRTLNLPKRQELKEALELGKIFHIIHNHIYANEGLSTQEGFNEILKLLFIKIQDEKDTDGIQVKFGILEDEYTQIMNGKKNDFRNRIEALFEAAKKQFSDVFNKNETINLKDSTLAFVVGQLQYFNLSKSKRDVKGAAFQKFIYAHQRGSRGQFFTPDPIINLSVNILAPKSSEKVLDPACGTAGFLVETMKYVQDKEFSKVNDKKKRGEMEKKYALENLRGMEINPPLARVAKMRMILEDDGYSGILSIDSLSDWEIIDAKARENGVDGSIKNNSFDLILTNPPFGTQGKITDRSYLKRFKLAYKWIKDKKSGAWRTCDTLQSGQVPDILFIERCMDLLNEKGKLAIVLPSGDMENRTLGYVRQYIKNNAKILAVISLPQKTFIPHGTGIKAVVLFVEKMKPEDLKKEVENDYQIFFSIIENVGYEGNKNGNPLYKKDEKGRYQVNEHGNPVLCEDISFVSNAYKKFIKNELKNEGNKAFTRRFSELKDRWDPEYYTPKFKELKKELKRLGAVPLKSVVKVISKRAEILKNKEVDVRYVEINNINPKTSELNSYSEMKVHELPSRATFEIKKGDIITAVSGISTGTPMHASAYVTEDFDGCICTNGMRVLRPLSVVDPFYLFAYIKSDLFLEQMLQCRTGAAIPAVSDEDLKEVLILIPDKEKQDIVSRKVKESYELREKSRKILEESRKLIPIVI